MNQTIDHKDRASRVNLEKQAYVRKRLDAELSTILPDFTGMIQIEIPVVRGQIGRVGITRTDRQND